MMVVVVGVLAAVLVPPYKLGSSSCAAFYGAALVTAPCYLLHVMPCRCAASCRCAQARTLRVPVPASLLACCRSHCSTHLVLPFTPYCHCDVLLQAVATNQVLVTVAMTMYRPLCRFCFPSPAGRRCVGQGRCRPAPSCVRRGVCSVPPDDAGQGGTGDPGEPGALKSGGQPGLGQSR